MPMPTPQDVAVFVDPVQPRRFDNDELFNPGSEDNLEGAHAPYFLLKDVFAASGIEVHTADHLMRGEHTRATNVYFSLGLMDKYHALSGRQDVVLSAFFTMEAANVQPSTFRRLPDASRHFRRIYSYAPADALAKFGCAGIALRKLHIPYPYEGVFDDLWGRGDRRFLCLLNWNRLVRMTWQELYTERLRALDHFSAFGEIDLYGLGWEEPPYRVGETWIPVTLTRINRAAHKHLPFLRIHPFERAVRRSYRGMAPSKYETQSGYTFTICYENMAMPGWLNENIFDCFMVGSIPIYLGPADVTDYVPAECFIDKRRFSTYAELRAYLHDLSPEDIRRYRENARDFMGSDRMRPFGIESFVGIFASAVQDDVGVAVADPATLSARYRRRPA
ncbi:MAG TPA: glycosyltransferase family 10 [Candidatus Dormibacteraeota bacterium]|nr:glycosyltransferase family 10 [Candidatus Dormibacteraeota bacterium]